MNKIPRRTFLNLTTIGALAPFISGCLPKIEPQNFFTNLTPKKDLQKTPPNEASLKPKTPALPQPEHEDYKSMYAARKDNGYSIPAIPYKEIPPQFLRQTVNDPTGELPGTIVVDTQRRYLYFVQENNKAIRYGVGIGRAGFAWSGRANIKYKRIWPTWTPPAEMIARQPKLKKYSAANGGMEPGLNNPLGARALYIFQDNKDTLYRVHGSPEWKSIGTAASSGCVRMLNQDIIDLYSRVSPNSPILVI